MLLNTVVLVAVAKFLIGSANAVSIGTTITNTEQELEPIQARQSATGLSASAFAQLAGRRSEATIYATDTIGAPQEGVPFNDFNYVNAASGHHRIARISMAGCEPGSHVSLIGFGFRDNFGESYNPVAWSWHGKKTTDQPLHELDLYKNESIYKIDVTTWRAKVGFRKHKTRVGWIKFTTSKGSSIECGSKYPTDPISVLSPKLNGQDTSLLHLSGSAGDAIDSIQGHFLDFQSW